MTSSDPLLDEVVDALLKAWFPESPGSVSDSVRESARLDASEILPVVRNFLATEIEAYARENHRHLDVYGLCPRDRLSADNCDLVAAYRNAARLVRGS